MPDDLPDISFAQRMGIAAMPAQAKAGSIEERTRAQVWVVILDWLLAYCPKGYKSAAVPPPTVHTLLRWWVNHKHRMVDEMPISFHDWQTVLKNEMQGDYVSVFNLVQFLLCDTDFNRKRRLADALEETQAAYRATDNILHPAVSDEESEAIHLALKDVGTRGASGAQAHLREAASRLTSGNWSGAVHESVSAVEAAARFVCENEKAVLSDLVKHLAKDGRINHPCLRDVLLKIYGYASDEKGVRHAQGALAVQNVSEREALYVFGLCASSISYILNAPETLRNSPHKP